MSMLRRCAIGLLIVSLAAPGCRHPTAEDRDNRRLVDEVLTAITLRNARLLEESAGRAEERHQAGQLRSEHYEAIAAFISKGRAGDWAAAESAAYEFRRQHPFVRPGER